MLEISMSHIIADCVSQSAYHSAAHALCQSLSRFVRLSTCWEAACAVSTGSTGPPAGTLQRRPRQKKAEQPAQASVGCQQQQPQPAACPCSWGWHQQQQRQQQAAAAAAAWDCARSQWPGLSTAG